MSPHFSPATLFRLPTTPYPGLYNPSMQSMKLATLAEYLAATLRVENPYLAFAFAIELFYKPPIYPPGIHPTAAVAPTAHVGANAHIGAYAVIGDNVTIGDNATILPHVVFYPHARAGNNLFAHAHAVVRE